MSSKKSFSPNSCKICKKDIPADELVCSRVCANKLLIKLLSKMKKKQPEKYNLEIAIMIKKGIAKKELSQAEAFSFPEIIDKFIIVAIKNLYLSKEKLIKNKKDYQTMKMIVAKGLIKRPVENPKILLSLLKDLWNVNSEIFCLNDICGNFENDRIVAASSKRMITMMTGRNSIKHEIARILRDTVMEVKQYGNNTL